jgi:cation diffusion facilitator family transporter
MQLAARARFVEPTVRQVRYRMRLAHDTTAKGFLTVIVALLANALVAIAKTLASVLTGSASMLAEAVHSWADTANEVFLVGAERTARRAADAQHPLGYGRESYVWSLFASVGTLVVGAIVGIQRGIGELAVSDQAADHAAEYWVGYLVIAISFALEGASFAQALRRVQKRAADRDQGVFEHVFVTSDSPLRAVFTEDLIALVALAVAALGMALRQFTGQVVYDASGSILIGILMGAAALMLMTRNRRFLEGRSLSPKLRALTIRLLKQIPEVERVTFLFTEFIGPDRLLLVAGVGIAGERTQVELACLLRDIEQRIMNHRNIGLAILTLGAPDEEDIGA